MDSPPVSSAAETPRASPRSPHPAFDILRRLWRNQNGAAGLIICGTMATLALVGPVIAPLDPELPNFLAFEKPPLSSIEETGVSVLGTDGLGRDVLSRLLHGGRITLASSIAATFVGLLIGSALGAIAGYAGGAVDNVLMRIVDLLLSFPSILLAILMVALLGPSLMNAVLAIAIVTSPVYARLLRACFLEELQKEYVTAAKALGQSHTLIAVKTVLPNCFGPLSVQATMGLAVCILDLSGLSFLGLGAQPPSPEWGAMLLDGLASYRSTPWVVLAPGTAIFLAVLGVNLLGDGLRSVLDPRLRR